MDLEYPIRLPLTWPKQYDKLILARIQSTLNVHVDDTLDTFALYLPKPKTYKASQDKWI